MSANKTSSVLALMLIAFISLLSGPASAGTIDYIYDDLNRLKEAHYPDGTIVKYEYDKIGNIIYKEMLRSPHVLVALIDGTGTGTVSSSPVGMDCGIFCVAKFNDGASITLTANPSPGSVFTGWSDAGCSGTGTCTVTLAADTFVTATFTSTACSVPPVRLKRGASVVGDYATLQEAYDVALDGDAIQALGVGLAGDLVANKSISVSVTGGYSCDFSAYTTNTVVYGSLTTNAGTVNASNLTLYTTNWTQ